jgi:hypothetical protein
MNYGILETIRGDDFDLSMAFYSTPRAMRRRLLETGEIGQIKSAIRSGSLTESTVRAFVDCLLMSLKKGERFRYETALSALAVVLEDRYTPFADEYLKSLASLSVAEMVLSSSVAKLSLEQRAATPVRFDLGSLGADESSDQAEGNRVNCYFTPGSTANTETQSRTPTLRRTGTCG